MVLQTVTILSRYTFLNLYCGLGAQYGPLILYMLLITLLLTYVQYALSGTVYLKRLLAGRCLEFKIQLL